MVLKFILFALVITVVTARPRNSGGIPYRDGVLPRCIPGMAQPVSPDFPPCPEEPPMVCVGCDTAATTTTPYYDEQTDKFWIKDK